jgi:hypothetical protein
MADQSLEMGVDLSKLIRKQGTFVCNGATNVVIADTGILATDVVIISLNTVGGTVGALPRVTTLTASSQFTVAGTASDTSTYNYRVLRTL